MSKCIQPQCKCTGYKEPQRPKNTLLQFKLNCQECGHQASEHRKLTPVDHYIKSEVAAGRRSKCTFLISPSDIPTSPVFSPLDLIMIPSEDDIRPSNVKENSVQCTCKGFKVPDVIRLCQAYRTHSMEDVTSKLKDSLCSFCNHPLSLHSLGPKGNSTSTESLAPALSLRKGPVLGPHHGLSVKASSSVVFSPVNSRCVDLLTDLEGKLALVMLGKGSSAGLLELKLLEWRETKASSIEATSKGGVAEPAEVGEAAVREDLSTSGTLSSSTGKRTKTAPLSEVKVTAAKRSRRSSRLATKKARMEELQVRRKLKGLKGAKRLYEEDEEEENDEGSGDEKCWTEEQVNQVGDAAAAFVGAIDNQDQYVPYQVPQKLTSVRNSSLLMSTLLARVWSETKQSSSVCFPIVLGSKELATLYLSVISASQREEMLEWMDVDCEGHGTVDCVHMKLQCGVQTDMDIVTLVVGMSDGIVRVWNLNLEGGNFKGAPVLLTEVDCSSRVLVAALSESSSDKLLAVGTASGEVAVSFLKDAPSKMEESSDRNGKTTRECPFSAAKSVPCSCAPITCMAWASNGQMLAVGGCDDAIQILQSVQPPKSLVKAPIGYSTIQTYFKRTDSFKWPKLVHTHTLKGHSSFIAGLTFSRGHYLVSLGWDGQLLFWRHLTQRRKLVSHSSSKCRPGYSEVEIAEPVGGYKIGPSPSAEFLPSLIRPLAAGCGFLVAMENKLGGVTVACYTKT